MGAKINMKRRADITADMVRAVLSYDPLTGGFVWTHPRSPRCKPGDKATCNDKGRLTVMVYGVRVPASHIAWLVSYGEWPDREVDHRDRDPLNTRLTNLRKSTTAQNCMNQGKRSHNTTGFKGVTAHASGAFWARISADGKRYQLGLYPEAWMAAAAYRIAASAMHGEFIGV